MEEEEASVEFPDEVDELSPVLTDEVEVLEVEVDLELDMLEAESATGVVVILMDGGVGSFDGRANAPGAPEPTLEELVKFEEELEIVPFLFSCTVNLLPPPQLHQYQH